MTSSMTSQGGLKVGSLHSLINRIITFFMITKHRANISSLNFLCICIIRLWLQLYEYIFMTSLMTSPGHKIGRGDNVFTLCVCLFVTLCLYRDVCPDDLTMKDWCHTNNILQVHCLGCLVVQVMFHALMTSSMTSPGHKVCQILKVIYLRQFELERRSKAQNVENAHGYVSGLFNFRYNFW